MGVISSRLKGRPICRLRDWLLGRSVSTDYDDVSFRFPQGGAPSMFRKANGQRPSESQASGSTRSCHQVTRSKAYTFDWSSRRPRCRLVQL